MSRRRGVYDEEHRRFAVRQGPFFVPVRFLGLRGVEEGGRG
jgi:hypothetical protein